MKEFAFNYIENKEKVKKDYLYGDLKPTYLDSELC